ncbi:5'-nucleotidase/2',3'-cyclic phosphodiesterase (plasmid) [Cylindrospermum sp. NIES-4074]|nr:5'-nucleotidase/2',3'-cyclic phosphodiesterase [Cylindrospermum sp. NIES-4074]
MALTQGDIAFTSFNADEDGWSIVTFVDINPNTIIYFSDNEATSLTAFNTGESYFQWNSGANTIAAGTVIRFSAIDNATNLAASIGTFSRVTVSGSANYGISATADTVYAYLGTNATSPTVFLTGISNDTSAQGTTDLTTAGLTVGVNSILLNSSADYGEYNGSRSGQTSFANYKLLVNNVSNWTVDTVNGVYDTKVPNTTNFAIASISPTVNLSVSTNSGSEAGTTAITVTAIASSAVSGNQTVNLGVTGTGITAGDYTLSNATITILSGTKTGSVTFTVVDDALAEGPETATLIISNPSSGITLGSTTSQDIIITDNDVAVNPTVNLSVSTNSGSEAGTTAITVTATASSAVSGNQTVNLGVTGTGITAGDYTLSNSTITIPSGTKTGSVTFTVVDDAVVENTETATLTIGSPSAGITLGSTISQNITITDNDVANATIVTTVTIAGNATDQFPLNGGANANRLGGFGSDFFYDYRQNVYYALVDRGAGGGVYDYQTRVEKFSLNIDPSTGAINSYQLLNTIAFTIPAGTTLNGVTYSTQTPFNGKNSSLLNGNGGILGASQDPEGFVVGKNGNFFVSDEYGPSIYEFSPTGSFIRALTPPSNVVAKFNGTPYYAGDGVIVTNTGRQDNRGYEGLAISPDGTKLLAIFQDPLQEEGSGGSNPGRNSRNVRIVRYDVATGQSDAQYIYQLESVSDINDRIPGTANDFSASAQGRNIGISSLVAINDHEFLVIERDNRGIGVDDPLGNNPVGSKRIYKIDLTGATDVSGISLAGTNTLPGGVTPVSKSLFLDIAGALQGAGQKIPEKFEGLAIGPQLADGSFALIVATDNDFSVTQNGSNTQFDVYTNGVSTVQVAIDSAPPTAPAGQPAYTLLPSNIYSFKTQASALNVTPVFDFSLANYSVTEGNTPGFSTNATVRVTRQGDLSATNTVQLQLSDGTATGSATAPTFAQTKGQSSSQTPYIVPVASGVSFTSILSAGDSIGGYKMVGVPDGLGIFDNNDGTFTLLMNHEIGATSGITHAHGSKGAFVSKWIINKSDLSVVSGGDLIQNVYLWNGSGFTQDTTAFNRFCSGDLAPVSAFYNSVTNLGTSVRIYLNGEENGAEGRAFAHIATGANAGTTYQLPSLGKFSWENAVASPTASNKTVVAGLDDATGGQVYFYVGTKTNTGTEIDQAGLNNGKLYGIAVTGLASETDATNLASGTRFTLADLGNVQNTTGANLQTQSVAAGVTGFLRPEDGAWDPSNPRDFYFNTTNGFNNPSRLWRLRFDDPTNPESGGTIEAVLNGTEGQKMFDNMAIDKYGHILLQEDVGNNAHIGKIWQYDIATDTLTQIAQHDPSRFLSGGANFLTQDEESSGIIDAQDILGAGWFLLDVQAHYGISGEVVEGGQLLAFFNPDTYKSSLLDYNNKPITVTFNPGETYKDVLIPIAGDSNPESNETVNLSLANPSTGTVVGTKQPTAVLTIVNDDYRIHNIQGVSHISPLNGQTVTNVPGIVTALKSNGFYLQDPNPDSDERTSEGIFVFTSSAPTVQVGDSVQVSGTVSEFRPGNDANNLTITEIISPIITKLSSGNPLPIATILGNGGRAIPTTVIENDASNVENSGTFDPVQDGIDFYESLEGMLVRVNNPVAVSPTNSFGEIWVLADDGANATGRTARGGIVISANDFNPERIQIDDTLFTNSIAPIVNVGASFSTITGVVDYSFNNYEVLPTSLTVTSPGSLSKEVTNLAPTTNQLTVATFNVENLDPGDGATKFNNIASRIVNNLKSPDIISLEEIQDNNGPTNNGVVDASTTYQTLINAIVASGGPTYQYRQIDPVNNTNGGEPGGNIRVGFLYNPNRVTFVDRSGGTSTSNTTVTNVGGVPTISASPGLIDPTNSAFNTSRKPLFGEFTFNGQTVYVISNHFNSKGGDQPLYGPNQLPALSSEIQRNQQATVVKNFVKSILDINPNANVVVAGDLNDFEFSNPLSTLESAGLNTLIETLPANERYTYNYQGNAQTLDQILLSNNLFNNLDGFDVVHINSEFADQDSDHDPVIARLNLLPTLEVNNVGLTEGNTTSNAQFTVTLSAVNSQQVSVNYTTVNGTAFSGYDYNATSGTLSFAPGETTKTVNVEVIGDLYNEVNETFQLQLSNPTNAIIKTVQGTATIINDDALPSFTISSLSLAEGDDGTRNANFNVQLSSASGQPVTVSYGTADGSALAGQDYTATNGILTFFPGTTLLTINVPILGDTTVEANETFTVNLSNPTGATLTTSQGTGTILNDDTVGGPVGLSLTGTSGNDTLTGGSADDAIFGLDGNDTLNGGSGDDSLTGGAGADILTGGLGADRFIYNSFSDSLFGTSTQDRIRDFNPGAGDRIIFNSLPTAAFNAGIISAANLTAAVTAAYSDADPTVGGSQPLGINQAVFFSFGATAATRRTYVSVNDGNADFNSSSDFFIEVTGLVGTLPTGPLTTNSYFAL